MGRGFEVDPSELVALAGRLSRAGAALSGECSVPGGGAATFGDESLMAAYAEFRDCWERGGQHLASDLGTAAECLQQNAKSYIGVDSDVAASLGKLA